MHKNIKACFLSHGTLFNQIKQPKKNHFKLKALGACILSKGSSSSHSAAQELYETDPSFHS